MNKKGFVLAETLVVTIFVLVIFTLLYNSALPLLARYDELSYYDDLDTTYDVYNFKKLLEKSDNLNELLSSNYKLLACNDLSNQNDCEILSSAIKKDINDSLTLLLYNTNNTSFVINSSEIKSEIKDYIGRLDIESNKNILLLEHNNYISYIELINTINKNDFLTKIKNKTCNGNPVYTLDSDSDITYISGSKECIDFNYVWWSGKMWRITAIYPDGAMKMVTENNITSIAFNDTVTYYDKTNRIKSYMFQWLNEDFLDTLYNHGIDVIDTTKYWNATMPADTNIETKPVESDATMIPTTESPVGLLNSYEYYKSYQNTSYGNGYLNLNYHWWLLNPYNESFLWNVNGSGYLGSGSGRNPVTYAEGVRPSIYLKSEISLSGSGTKDSPYRLVDDYDEVNTDDEINTRHSGEYVKLSNNGIEQLFRIVEVVDNKTKIVAMDYVENRPIRKFATNSSDTLWGSGTTTGTDTWYTYLNGTYYPNLVSTYGALFDSGLYYLGTSGENYKLSVCANTTSENTKVCDKTSQVGTFNIGLLRYGEMFATGQGNGYSSSINMWLINRYNTSNVWNVLSDGSVNYGSPTLTSDARPTIHLKSTVKILSGTGTELDPYVVGL